MGTPNESSHDQITLYLKNIAVTAHKSKLSIAFPNFFHYFRRENLYLDLEIKHFEISEAVRRVLGTFINYSENENLDEVFEHSVFDVYLVLKWPPMDNQRIYDETIRRLKRNFQENEHVAETLEFAIKHQIKSVLRAHGEIFG